MSRSHGYSVAARAGKMRCASIKSLLVPTESLLIGAINGVLVLIIFAGLASQDAGPSRTKSKRQRGELGRVAKERLFVKSHAFLAIANRVEWRSAIVNEIIKGNPSSYYCGRLRKRAAKKRTIPRAVG